MMRHIQYAVKETKAQQLAVKRVSLIIFINRCS
jgi:hypothetical protein